jgi:hypothetical protein
VSINHIRCQVEKGREKTEPKETQIETETEKKNRTKET